MRENKPCSKCKIDKPGEDYHKNKRSSDGFQTVCKECNKINTKQRDPEHWRKQNLRRNFGITLEQYSALLASQDNKCAVCNRDQNTFKKRLAVDHNHKTGEIRGLLCEYCNYRMIGRHTDSALLRKMADYLDRKTGWFVPANRPVRKRKRKHSGK